MMKVLDSEYNRIGSFDGRNVYDLTGEKLYWLDDGEVYSVPGRDDDYQFGARPHVKIGEYSEGLATDAEGHTLFRLGRS